MPSIKKSALVMHSAQQMYDIVTDIEAYPEFLQWCRQATILNQVGAEVIAKVDVNYKGIEQSFTTRNVNQNAVSISMELHGESHSFEYMSGGWSFSPLEMQDTQACKVEFNLDFSMKNKIAATLFKTVFNQMINSQVDGFVKRAKHLYG